MNLAGLIGCGLPGLALVSLVSGAGAQSPSFELTFENSLIGESGEAPTSQSGISFESGVLGQCAVLGANSNLGYAAEGNINALEGTLELWVKPRWDGSESGNHAFLGWGGGGGMLFARDGASNLRGIFNRFGPGGVPEMGVGSSAADWTAGQWYHVAYTWSDSGHFAKLYVNGFLESEAMLSAALPNVADVGFLIGHEVFGSQVEASIDELRIYAAARSDAQVASDFASSLSIQSIAVTPESDTLYTTWRSFPTVMGQTVLGWKKILPASVQWTSADPAVVAVEPGSILRAVGPGVVTVTASFGTHTDTMEITVVEAARAPEEPSISQFLRSPADGWAYEVPVLSLRFVPTPDGTTVDEAATGYSGQVEDVLGWIDSIEVETKFMLEEGSRFRGWGDPTVRPSVGYRVVRTVNVFEPMPPDWSFEHPTGSPGAAFPDFMSILNRFGLGDLVENEGVREVWIWGYHRGVIVPVESNMASPVSGDISNSNRFADDLPIFGHTYTVYNYNWTRSSNESVHDHGHQIEAVMSHVCQLQDGNTDLFWKRFVGQDGNGSFVTGRCGWTHMPPNTTSDYDYENPAVVPSDIAAWTPAGGPTQEVSVDTWGSLHYAWPAGTPPAGLTEHSWYVYWMQAIPGLGNTIRHDVGTGSMTNWWSFIADWDRLVPLAGAGLGLHTDGAAIHFTVQPVDTVACQGNTVLLHAHAEGVGAVSYRWKAGSDWIGNGATGNGSETSGAFTDTLAITNVMPEDAVSFVCIAVCPSGDVTSAAAKVSLMPDINGDGAVNTIDLILLLQAFGQTVPPAPAERDLNSDGAINTLDLILLLQRFGQTC